MTQRSIASIVFAVIVLIELYFFFNESTPMTGSWYGNDLSVNNEAVKNQNMSYGILIGATILIGAIVTFSLPNKK